MRWEKRWRYGRFTVAVLQMLYGRMYLAHRRISDASFERAAADHCPDDDLADYTAGDGGENGKRRIASRVKRAMTAASASAAITPPSSPEMAIVRIPAARLPGLA